jgi:hypothetical protein
VLASDGAGVDVKSLFLRSTVHIVSTPFYFFFLFSSPTLLPISNWHKVLCWQQQLDKQAIREDLLCCQREKKKKKKNSKLLN